MAAPKVIEAAAQRLEQTAGGPARLQIILMLAGALGLDGGDKAMVSAVAGRLEHVFNVGHAEIGLLIAATSFVGAAFTLAAGVLVDLTRRNRLLMIGVACWTVATAVSGAATSYFFLLGAQLAVGLLTAVVSPAVASLTGDYFPARTRAAAYGLILAGELIGTGLGFVFASEISSALDWRWPFFLAAAPGALFLLALWRWLPEPARGGQSWIEFGQRSIPTRDHGREAAPTHGDRDEQELSEASRIVTSETGAEARERLVLRRDPSHLGLFGTIGYLLRIPTYTLLIIASALAWYFFSAVRAFGMIYFTQHYGVSRATLGWVVVLVGVGAIVGGVASGRIAEWLLERGWPRIRIILPGVALFVAALAFAPAIWVKNIYLGAGLFTVGAIALAAANPPIDAARLDILLPNLWGRGEAGRMALRGVLEGGAPLLVGVVSVWLGGGEIGLQWAFLLMLIPLLVASLLAIPLSRTYPRDVATTRESFAEVQKKREEGEEGRETATSPPDRSEAAE